MLRRVANLVRDLCPGVVCVEQRRLSAAALWQVARQDVEIRHKSLPRRRSLALRAPVLPGCSHDLQDVIASDHDLAVLARPAHLDA